MSPPRALLHVSPAFVGLAFVLLASCAVKFTDYPVGQGAAGGGGSTADGSLSPDGTPCSSDGECLHGSCIESNAGTGTICCATPCTDNGTVSCFTNGKCDAGGAGCALYPAGKTCGPTTCQDGMLTARQCQLGTCSSAPPVPCPGGLVCSDEATCAMTCATNADCESPGATCTPGSPFCDLEPAGSPCSANTQCASGYCGATGSGHCCASACNPAGGTCGATDCDAMGKCLFPDTDTPCGPLPSCSDGMLTSKYCNGIGACGNVTMEKPCAGDVICQSRAGCLSTCGSNDPTGDALCSPGHWCDGSICRKGMPPGAPCARPKQCASSSCFFLCL